MSVSTNHGTAPQGNTKRGKLSLHAETMLTKRSQMHARDYYIPIHVEFQNGQSHRTGGGSGLPRAGLGADVDNMWA